MKLNKKGFTLIELLVTIVIIGLVIGLSVYGIIQIVENTENKKITLSVSSIKEAARIYSGESDSGSWKDSTDYELFCVTIGELMNKGLLDKNASIENNLTKDSFVVVKRNKVTLAIEKEEFAIEDDSNYDICTSQVSVPSENIIQKPEITDSISYTDKIEISFNKGSATYNGVVSETSYRCLYGFSSSMVNREGKIDGNKCMLDGLKHNSNYYTIIYMDTNHGSTVASGEPKEISTTDFVSTEIQQDQHPESIYIMFNDKDNQDKNINLPSYYFKSTVNANSDKDLYECSLNNDTFSCADAITKDASQNVWYKTNDKIVVLTYPLETNRINITTRIYDGSNNYKEDKEDFEVNKHIIKFHKNNAESIGGGTSDVIERTCVTSASETCNITAPTIEAPMGYEVIGWNTSSAETTSMWDANTSKKINYSGDYYAIIKEGYYTITYDANGDNVNDVPPLEKVNVGNSTNISEKIPTRTDYIFTSWNTNADGSGNSYQSGTTYVPNENIVLYAQWDQHIEHEWLLATGKQLFTVYDEQLFTCNYYHTKGYARYCSICGMSARYYKYVLAQDIAQWWCPCEVKSKTIIFDDSKFYSTINTTSWNNIQNQCGLTCGQPLLDKVATVTSVCTEHTTENHVSSRQEGTT